MIYEFNNVSIKLEIIDASNKHSPVIYCLIDPRDGIIRYIGKALVGSRRIYEHIKPSSLVSDGNTRKAQWIKSLLKQNLKPVSFIIKKFELISDREQLNSIMYKEEHEIIDYFKLTLKHELLNHCDGGEGSSGRRVGEDTQRKMSLAAKSREIPLALLMRQLPKYGPPVPKSYYYKKKPRKDPENKYLNSLKKGVIGINLTTNIEIFFDSTNDCEKYFKGMPETRKFNRNSLRRSIRENKSYYGYYWSFSCHS